jgi:release factor glutamine methyltransferase
MVIQEARKDLQQKLSSVYNNNESGIIADWVIESITGKSRSERIVNKSEELSDVQQEKIDAAQRRLLSHEPVQYVLNESWFCGMKFYVDNHVLIPRPETEELVEWIISNLKFPFQKLRILDIGTGSGCIAVSLKRKLRKAEVWACDISKDALQVAHRNAKMLHAGIHFVQLDFLDKEDWNKLPVFDIVVSNPPYVPVKDKEQMNRNVLDFEPHLALFVPDDDALKFYKAIATFGKQHLHIKGSIFLELHEEYAAATSKLYETEHYEMELKRDMQGKDRMLRANFSPINSHADSNVFM